jgi:hypothetical protein
MKSHIEPPLKNAHPFIAIVSISRVSIEQQVATLAAGFCDQQAAVAGRAVQSAVIVAVVWLVVSADGKPLQGAPEYLG